jgi:hypothetical protein
MKQRRECDVAVVLQHQPPVTPAPAERPWTTNGDCPRGQACEGAAGCDEPWRCVRPRAACSNDTQYFCGCGGESFRASMSCPGRPYRHRGSCPAP